MEGINLAFITKSQVREQLAALGFRNVPDDVLEEFVVDLKRTKYPKEQKENAPPHRYARERVDFSSPISQQGNANGTEAMFFSPQKTMDFRVNDANDFDETASQGSTDILMRN
jgi:hypothetical protein